MGTTINHHVRPSALTLQRLVGFSDMLIEKGYRVDVEAETSRVSTPPADLAGAFPSVLPQAETFVSETRFFADGQLTIVVRDATPWSYVMNESQLPSPSDLKSFDFSRPYLKHHVDHAVVEIIASVKSASPTKLPIDAGQPFTRLLERHYTTDADLVAVSIIDVDNARVVFEIVRRR